MKHAVIAIAISTVGISTVAGGAASAAGRVTDVDYLRASRCNGLASSIDGVVDATALNNFIKAERGARPTSIIDRGDAEFQRARKEAKNGERRERLTAELASTCQAYVGGAAGVAKP